MIGLYVCSSGFPHHQRVQNTFIYFSYLTVCQYAWWLPCFLCCLTHLMLLVLRVIWMCRKVNGALWPSEYLLTKSVTLRKLLLIFLAFLYYHGSIALHEQAGLNIVVYVKIPLHPPPPPISVLSTVPWGSKMELQVEINRNIMKHCQYYIQLILNIILILNIVRYFEIVCVCVVLFIYYYI